jgi:hypothetical protein
LCDNSPCLVKSEPPRPFDGGWIGGSGIGRSVVEAEYHPSGFQTTPRYRGVTYTTPINAANEAVPVIDLADRLCGPGGLRHVGEKWVARCPLPDHEDRSPSFTVYPGKGGWFCYGCLHGGDVVELYRLVRGFDQRDAHAAAGHLLLEFGHQPPERPASWHRKQERQKQVRDGLEDIKVRALRRTLYRMVDPLIADDEDAEKAWDECLPLARLWLRTMDGERKAG